MRWDTLIIGAGQAGMAAAYWLKKASVPFIMLDRGERHGQVWEERYDSLRLFTPRTHSALPGLPLEGDPDGFPDKAEMAAYLAKYADMFEFPIRYGDEVFAVHQEEEGFLVNTAQGDYHARQVIVATGPFQTPRIPELAASLPADIVQLHSSSYRNPSQLQSGSVLVVGGGNSGAQIAYELSHTRETHLSMSKRPRHLPMVLGGKGMFWWLDKLGLLRASSTSFVGKLLKRQGDPIFGYELKQAMKYGKVKLHGKTVGGSESGVRFEDDSELQVRNIVWATGFASDYGWLQMKGALNDEGGVRHSRGISPVPGLYYVGLPWQTHRGSALLAGVSEDARCIVEAILEKRG
ncbi:flavin-containing monooxygenase [Paenibacillus campinasensis]|uniref:Oxidoreductase n=1 Tax=Paenibacillus campinasensis TaxID=66347 RepID=A0A268ELH5_9BACL|nr:NAD(P)/FAD-dependent oxidoreductase [Paenibacillus campinasensis]PAD73972.1 oxidoreductase [Paenibacillus campinasensis]